MSKLLLAPLLPLALLAAHDAESDRGVGSRADLVGTRVTDLDGTVRRIGIGVGLEREPRSTVLLFLDTGCPIANKYAPRLNELAREAAEKEVDFLGVISDPSTSAAEARAHRAEYGLDFPVLFDASGELADRLRPTHVPEAFVVDADDRLLYRGRVDDRFEAVGKQRASVTSHDLRDAIHGVAARTLEPTATEPVGCVFEAWTAPREAAPVTYNRDVAPILNANCVDCHRAGDVGPFPLDSYADARRRAKMIAEVTRGRSMPPWFAESDAAHFRDERALSRKQIALLQSWADSGAVEGRPEDLLPAPTYRDERWRLGQPDLVIEMPEPYEVPAEGDDIYRYFVVPSRLAQDRHIVAIDFRPGDPTVVHHCIAYLDRTGVAARIDALSEEPGFSVFGEQADSNGERFQPNGLDTSSQIAGWAPGTQPYVLPPGVGQRLEKGGDFVLEIHYHLTGKSTRDQSALALYFADGPVEREALGLVIGTQNIDIQPGEDLYLRHVYMDVPANMDVIDVSPHMHYLGKEVEVVATLPDSETKLLIGIDAWDFRWQGAYFYTEPVHLPKGARIDAFFSFDNSAENPFNPSTPPGRVREGWRTTDEMCLFYFTVVPEDPADAEAIFRETLRSFQRSGAPD